MYVYKNAKLDEAFRQKQELLSCSYSFTDVFKFLESKRRYWLVESDEDVNLASRPYNEAIKELEKIKYCNSPREKLKCTMMMRSMMRAAVIDFHKGTEELASMDDELPIVIYIILYSNIPNIFAELSMIEDFISMDPTIETE